MRHQAHWQRGGGSSKGKRAGKRAGVRKRRGVGNCDVCVWEQVCELPHQISEAEIPTGRGERIVGQRGGRAGIRKTGEGEDRQGQVVQSLAGGLM